jgi:hypothetical protein
MPVNFKYAMVEINGKPVLVDQKKIGDASSSLRKAVTKIEGMTDTILKAGFALQTPDGMKPVILGSADDFSVWVSTMMKSDFSLSKSIEDLPEPFKSGLSAIVRTDLVIYSAALFYTGASTVTALDKKLFGELVIGFQVPDDVMKDFPLRLREIVIQVNNYPPPPPPKQ